MILHHHHPIMELIAFVVSVVLLITWCVLCSRIGQIRDEATKHTALLQQLAEAQERQADALEGLIQPPRSQEAGPPVLSD